MAYMIVYMLCLSGSALTAALGSERSAYAMAITPLALTFVVYIAGLCGALNAGVYAVYTLAAAAWIAAIIIAVLHRDVRETAKRFFTPAWLIFTVLTAFLALGAHRMQVHTWDEFSHWAYSVQEMLLNGQLYTSKLSDDFFKAYPPLMPLWQYMCQLIYGEKAITDGLLYFCEQLLAGCVLMPFLHRLHWKRPLPVILAALAVIGLPAAVYGDHFELLYIDSYLGIFAGAAFAMIALNLWKRPLGIACLALTEAALVLTKDSGLAFAAVSLLYLLILVATVKDCPRRWTAFLYVCAAVAAAKLSWSLHLSACSIASSSLKIDLADFRLLLTGGAPDSYRHEVIANLGQFLVLDDTLRLTVFNIPVSYLVVMLLLSIGAGFLCVKRRDGVLLSLSLVICTAIYLFGILMLFLYFFAPYNGLRLISAGRYIKSMVQCLFVVCAACALWRTDGRKQNPAMIAVLAALLILVPWQIPGKYAVQTIAQETREKAAPFRESAEIIRKGAQMPDGERPKVYLALQTGEDLSYYGIHYYARPYAEVNRDRWHMGAERRIDQVNIWVVSPEQWSELLKRYDYVYVLNADEYLQETYGDMTDKAFEPRTIYKVLNEDGKVRLVSSGIDLYN
ncbi:MAG: hypothetical protein II481_00105 [Clostridia bacterium]|nr:hypothetical protein [Clostridia bacterium]